MLLNKFNKQRKKFAQYYDNKLKGIEWLEIPKCQNNSDHVYHQYSILLSSEINRNHFQKYLFNKGIPTMIYYPKPLHKQKAYSLYSQKSLPISEMISRRIISLPMHSELDFQQMEFICNTLQKYI